MRASLYKACRKFRRDERGLSAVEIAIAATQEVLRGQMTPERHAALVDDSIRDLRRQLN